MRKNLKGSWCGISTSRIDFDEIIPPPKRVWDLSLIFFTHQTASKSGQAAFRWSVLEQRIQRCWLDSQVLLYERAYTELSVCLVSSINSTTVLKHDVKGRKEKHRRLINSPSGLPCLARTGSSGNFLVCLSNPPDSVRSETKKKRSFPRLMTVARRKKYSLHGI